MDADGNLKIISPCQVMNKLAYIVTSDSLTTSNSFFSNATVDVDWWLLVAVAEFIIILILIVLLLNKRTSSTLSSFKNDSLKEQIDFSNIIDSSFNSINLYDKLKVKCHPDRFATDQTKFDIAESLFQQITSNKNNVKKLQELKEEAISLLNIKI
jgi:hypothetical protein